MPKKVPTSQGDYEVGHKKPPKDTQFGGKRANPRNPGAWKKEDTARYKLETMMKMSSKELTDVRRDENAPVFEKKLAEAMIDGKWKEIESMIDQVYGKPAQSVDHTSKGQRLQMGQILDDIEKDD